MRLLPAPHGELRRVRVEIPGALSARAEDVDVYLRLWPLLRGRAEIASVSVSRPEVRIAAAGGEGGRLPSTRSPRIARRRAGGARAAANSRRIRYSRIEAAAIDLPAVPLQLRGLNVAARTRGEGVELRARHGEQLLAAAAGRRPRRVRRPVGARRRRARRPGGATATCRRRSLRAQAAHRREDRDRGGLPRRRWARCCARRKAKLRCLPAGAPHELTAETSGSRPCAGAGDRAAQAGRPGRDRIGRRAASRRRCALVARDRNGRRGVRRRSSRTRRSSWRSCRGSCRRTRRRSRSREKRGSTSAALRGALGESSFSDVAAQARARQAAAPVGGFRPGDAAGSSSGFPGCRQQLPLEEISRAVGQRRRGAAAPGAALRPPGRGRLRRGRDAAPGERGAEGAAGAGQRDGRLGAGRAPPQVRLDRLAVAMLDAKALVSGTVAMKGPQARARARRGRRWARSRAMGARARRGAGAPGAEDAAALRREAHRLGAAGRRWRPTRRSTSTAAPPSPRSWHGSPTSSSCAAWRSRTRAATPCSAPPSAAMLLQASFSGTLYGRSLAVDAAPAARRPQGDSGVARGKLR